MSVWGWITGGSGVEMAGKVLDAGIAAADKLFYTQEEKAENATKIAGIWLEAMKTSLGESTARAMTRRILAIMTLGSFLLLLLTAAGVYLYNQAWAAHILAVAALLTDSVLAISIFYFGYYGVKAILKKD